MRIILFGSAAVELAAAVTNVIQGDWMWALVYFVLALASIGWALAEASAKSWKQVAAARQEIIDSTKAEK